MNQWQMGSVEWDESTYHMALAADMMHDRTKTNPSKAPTVRPMSDRTDKSMADAMTRQKPSVT